jgi:endonuclease-3
MKKAIKKGKVAKKAGRANETAQKHAPKTASKKSVKADKNPAAAKKPSAALRARAKRIGEMLDALYPDPAIPLHHQDPYTLCLAVLMSAHTTDKSVNKVTPELFRRAPVPEAMVRLGIPEIQKIIKTVGLAPTKARNIWNLSRILVEQYGGRLPRTFEELEALPGVGHKTASVVMAQAFDTPAFPVDTHIHRLAERWGLSSGRNVVQTEKDLKALYPPEEWGLRHLQFIYYGREKCPAQRHDAESCGICREFGTKK